MTWIDSVCVRLISGLARRETRLQDGSLKHVNVDAQERRKWCAIATLVQLTIVVY